MRWLMARSMALMVDVELGELGTDTALTALSATALALADALGVAFVLLGGCSAVAISVKPRKKNHQFVNSL